MAGIRKTAIVPTDQAIGDGMTKMSRNAGRKSPARGGNTSPPPRKRTSASSPKR